MMIRYIEPNNITLEEYIEKYPTILNSIFQLQTESQTNQFINTFKSVWNEYVIGGFTEDEFLKMIKNRFNAYKPYYQDLINVYSKELNYEDGIKQTIEYDESHEYNTSAHDVNQRTLVGANNGTHSESYHKIDNESNVAAHEGDITDSYTGNKEINGENSKINNSLNSVYDLPRSNVIDGTITNKTKNDITENNAMSISEDTENSAKKEFNNTDTSTINRDEQNTINSTDAFTKNTSDNENNTHTNETDGIMNYKKTITGGVDVVDLRERYLKYIRDLYLDFANRFKDCFNLVYA